MIISLAVSAPQCCAISRASEKVRLNRRRESLSGANITGLTMPAEGYTYDAEQPATHHHTHNHGKHREPGLLHHDTRTEGRELSCT